VVDFSRWQGAVAYAARITSGWRRAPHSKEAQMRLRILLPALALVAAFVLPSATSARQSRSHEHGHRGSHQILGTWSATVTPDGQPSFQALLTIHAGGGLTETESDAPGTGLGAWEQVGRHSYRFAIETFIFTATGASGGHVIVRGLTTLKDGTLSGRFKFDVYDPSGNVVLSGSGTATATRFQIPAF
jgi:hypothetical protein